MQLGGDRLPLRNVVVVRQQSYATCTITTWTVSVPLYMYTVPYEQSSRNMTRVTQSIGTCRGEDKRTNKIIFGQWVMEVTGSTLYSQCDQKLRLDRLAKIPRYAHLKNREKDMRKH
jgi:hypothetical protein